MWFENCGNSVLIILGSFFVGFLGSGAYFFSVKFGFAGGNTEEDRNFTLNHFRFNGSKLLYMFFGGFIATILQLVTPNIFVPFQSLITGITWPSIVSGLLSGKQAERGNDDKEKDLAEVQKQFKFNPDSKKQEKANELELDKFIEELSRDSKILKESRLRNNGGKKDEF